MIASALICAFCLAALIGIAVALHYMPDARHRFDSQGRDRVGL